MLRECVCICRATTSSFLPRTVGQKANKTMAIHRRNGLTRPPWMVYLSLRVEVGHGFRSFLVLCFARPNPNQLAMDGIFSSNQRRRQRKGRSGEQSNSFQLSPGLGFVACSRETPLPIDCFTGMWEIGRGG